jgi:hypothetical protein
MTLSATPSRASSTAWAWPQLMRRKTPPQTGLDGKTTKLDPDPGARPGPATSGAVDDAEQRPDRQLGPVAEPGRQLLPAPGVHADLAPTATLALAHEQRPPPCIEVALAQRERLLDAEPGAPEHDDQRPQASAVAIVGSSAHHRDDFLDGRRVGGIELPLVAGRATGVVARQGCGRSPPTGGIERSRDGHGICSQWNRGQGLLLYRRCASEREITLPALPTPCGSRRLGDQTPHARPFRASAGATAETTATTRARGSLGREISRCPRRIGLDARRRVCS